MKISKVFNFETNLFLTLLAVMLLGAIIPDGDIRLTN